MQGPKQIHNTARPESFWPLVTLILVMTSELIIYMLYNTSQETDCYLAGIMVVVLVLLHSRFVREIRSLLRGVAAISAQVGPFEQDVASGRAPLWTQVSLPLRCISRRNGNIHPVQQLRLFVDSQCSTGARNLWWLPAKSVRLPWR